MSFKTPQFWYRDPHGNAPLSERLLTPVSFVYQILSRIEQSLKRQKYVDIPVICVGNLTAGGAGKTPTAIALMNVIKRENIFKNPYFLTRGYGGQTREPHLVNTNVDTFDKVGDEALLLARHAPTVVAKNRYKGAQHAMDNNADAIIMDDGLLNNTLRKDLNLCVIDGKNGFGNLKTIPAGPLRMPIQGVVDDIDAYIIIGEDRREVFQYIDATKLVKAFIEPTILLDQNQNYLAFCGLGLPQKFYTTLRAMKLNIVSTESFADHHPYTPRDIEKLLEKAKHHNAQLVTTRKDLVRIPQNFHYKINVLPIELNFYDEERIIKHLKTLTGAA